MEIATGTKPVTHGSPQMNVPLIMEEAVGRLKLTLIRSSHLQNTFLFLCIMSTFEDVVRALQSNLEEEECCIRNPQARHVMHAYRTTWIQRSYNNRAQIMNTRPVLPEDILSKAVMRRVTNIRTLLKDEGRPDAPWTGLYALSLWTIIEKVSLDVCIPQLMHRAKASGIVRPDLQLDEAYPVFVKGLMIATERETRMGYTPAPSTCGVGGMVCAVADLLEEIWKIGSGKASAA